MLSWMAASNTGRMAHAGNRRMSCHCRTFEHQRAWSRCVALDPLLK
jgi:hypothetical protein